MLERVAFSIRILQDHSRRFEVICNPSDYEILGLFLNKYKNSKKVSNLISNIESCQLSKCNDDFGEDEISMFVESDIVVVELSIPNSNKYKLDTESVLDFFRKYQKWLEDYENGKIRGLIPE